MSAQHYAALNRLTSALRRLPYALDICPSARASELAAIDTARREFELSLPPFFADLDDLDDDIPERDGNDALQWLGDALGAGVLEASHQTLHRAAAFLLGSGAFTTGDLLLHAAFFVPMNVMFVTSIALHMTGFASPHRAAAAAATLSTAHRHLLNTTLLTDAARFARGLRHQLAEPRLLLGGALYVTSSCLAVCMRLALRPPAAVPQATQDHAGTVRQLLTGLRTSGLLKELCATVSSVPPAPPSQPNPRPEQRLWQSVQRLAMSVRALTQLSSGGGSDGVGGAAGASATLPPNLRFEALALVTAPEVQELLRQALRRMMADAGVIPSGGTADGSGGTGGLRRNWLSADVPLAFFPDRELFVARAHRHVLAASLGAWAQAAALGLHDPASLPPSPELPRLCAGALEAFHRLCTGSGAGGMYSQDLMGAPHQGFKMAEVAAEAVAAVVDLLDHGARQGVVMGESAELAAAGGRTALAADGEAAALAAAAWAVTAGASVACEAAAAVGAAGTVEGPSTECRRLQESSRSALLRAVDLMGRLAAGTWPTLRADPPRWRACAAALASAGLPASLDRAVRLLVCSCEPAIHVRALRAASALTVSGCLPDVLHAHCARASCSAPGSASGTRAATRSYPAPQSWESGRDLGVFVSGAKVARSLSGGLAAHAAAGPTLLMVDSDTVETGWLAVLVAVGLGVRVAPCSLLAPAAPSSGGGERGGGGGGGCTPDPSLLTADSAEAAAASEGLARRDDVRDAARVCAQLACRAATPLLEHQAAALGMMALTRALIADSGTAQSPDVEVARLNVLAAAGIRDCAFALGRMLRCAGPPLGSTTAGGAAQEPSSAGLGSIAAAAPLEFLAACGEFMFALPPVPQPPQPQGQGHAHGAGVAAATPWTVAAAAVATVLTLAAAHPQLASQVRRALRGGTAAAAPLPPQRQQPQVPDLRDLLAALPRHLPALSQPLAALTAGAAADSMHSGDRVTAFRRCAAVAAVAANDVLAAALGVTAALAEARARSAVVAPSGAAAGIVSGGAAAVPGQERAASVAFRLCANPTCACFIGDHEALIAKKMCGRCRAVRYCCPEHQQEHWAAGHRQECRATS